MTAFLLCQGPHGCDRDAYYRASAAGTCLSKTVCADPGCVAWAKGQLSSDALGAELLFETLMAEETL